MTDPRQEGRLTFILCIKPDSSICADLLQAQISSCLSVPSAQLLIGLSEADERIESAVQGNLRGGRVRLAVLNDCSLYDGWNKAVELVETPYLAFLGYGDCVVNPLHFEHVDLAGLDALFARVLVFSQNANRLMGRRFNWHIHYWRQRVAMIGAIFCKDFIHTERFDPTLKIVGDYEFLLRAGKRMKAGFVPLTVATMPAGGLSDQNFERLMAEVRDVRRRRRSV